MLDSVVPFKAILGTCLIFVAFIITFIGLILTMNSESDIKWTLLPLLFGLGLAVIRCIQNIREIIKLKDEEATEDTKEVILKTCPEYWVKETIVVENSKGEQKNTTICKNYHNFNSSGDSKEHHFVGGAGAKFYETHKNELTYENTDENGLSELEYLLDDFNTNQFKEKKEKKEKTDDDIATFTTDEPSVIERFGPSGGDSGGEPVTEPVTEPVASGDPSHDRDHDHDHDSDDVKNYEDHHNNTHHDQVKSKTNTNQTTGVPEEVVRHPNQDDLENSFNNNDGPGPFAFHPTKYQGEPSCVVYDSDGNHTHHAKCDFIGPHGVDNKHTVDEIATDLGEKHDSMFNSSDTGGQLNIDNKIWHRHLSTTVDSSFETRKEDGYGNNWINKSPDNMKSIIGDVPGVEINLDRLNQAENVCELSKNFYWTEAYNKCKFNGVWNTN